MKKKKKINKLYYALMKVPAGFVGRVIFKRKFLRNEIKDVQGAAVVIGNHQAALDFTTLVTATKRQMTFVISDSFYNTLPFKKYMNRIGVIPKQQFQTSLNEVSRMRATVKDGGILMVYPAGLMSEDGLSTPIPATTYKFLQWLGADVYAARTSGTYFCTPKWSKKMHPGRTYMDVYKLIDKDELAAMSEAEIKERVDGALLFDAYREQETLMVKYKGASNIEGLENVLYACPHCEREFTVRAKDKSTLYCTACGFAHTADDYGFLHNTGSVGDEIRYVSDWSRLIYERTRKLIVAGEVSTLSAETKLQTILHKKKKYVDVGCGTVTLTPEKFIIEGTVSGEEIRREIPLSSFASIPFKPGCRIEVQDGNTTYRCVLTDGRLAAKFVNMVELFYEKNHSAAACFCDAEKEE